MPARLTPTQALDPAMVDRLAVAEFIYERMMQGFYPPPPEWWALTPEWQEEWRAKARELLTDLVNDTP